MVALLTKTVKTREIRSKSTQLISDLYDVLDHPDAEDIPGMSDLHNAFDAVREISEHPSPTETGRGKLDVVEMGRVMGIPAFLDGFFLFCAQHHKARSHPEWARCVDAMRDKVKQSGLVEDVTQLMAEEMLQARPARGSSFIR